MAKPANDAQKSAVALAYSQTDAAPRVVAKGRGLVAEQIGAIDIGLDESLHRHAVKLTACTAEVVGKACEAGLVIARRLQFRLCCKCAGEVDQKIAGHIGVDGG